FEKMGIKTFLPTSEQLTKRNKNRLSELLVGNGKISYPESINITNAQFFHTCEEQGWIYPFVVKGVFYDAEIVYNAAQGTAAFNSISAQWGFPIIAQKLVRGEEYNVVALGDSEGELAGMVMMKKIALTAKGKANAGVSIYDENLHQACLEIMKTLRWKGPLEFEVMRDKQNRYHLIEINPRFPSWVYLTAGVGQNLPIKLLKLLTGESISTAPSKNAGILFIRHAMESIVPMSSFESVAIEGGTL
ncbi:MAG: ATP-grasp domain-containing protein, partial [Gammaproteobacteria bacterium]